VIQLQTVPGPAISNRSPKDSAALQAELERILASRHFRGSERRTRLLRYLVDKAIAGQPLKEYAIGIDAFEKPPDYDPRLDPSVRVEMARLRSRLADYYAGEGKANPGRLELPKRSYTAEFLPAVPRPTPLRSRALWVAAIAVSAVAALAIPLLSHAIRQQNGTPPENPQARDLCARARFFWNKRTPEALRTGLALYQEAIRVAPRYAPAYAGEAMSYAVMATNSQLPAEQASRLTAEAAKEAIVLDSNVAEAYAALGLVTCEVDLDPKTADAEFTRALALNPNFATARQWRALCLFYAGRQTEALAESARAVELAPVSMPVLVADGMLKYYSRHYDDAIDRARKILEMEPTFRNGHLMLGEALEAKHDWTGAESEFRTVALASTGDGEGLARLAHLYAVSGRRAQAEEILQKLIHGPADRYVDPYQLAFIYTALNEKPLAFAWLARAVRQSTASIMKVDPYLDPLRGDPRFQELLAASHLN
jgi:tetratricopeptide (TPR) repeat protein